METSVKCVKQVSYKGHVITKLEDAFGQEFVRIDNVVTPDYASINDAKRVINGESPIWFEDGYMWDETAKKVVKDPNARRWQND